MEGEMTIEKTCCYAPSISTYSSEVVVGGERCISVCLLVRLQDVVYTRKVQIGGHFHVLLVFELLFDSIELTT